MSINEITAKIESLKEWESLAAETTAQVESIKDELKQFMQEQGVEEYEAWTHIIRWTTVTEKGTSASGRTDAGKDAKMPAPWHKPSPSMGGRWCEWAGLELLLRIALFFLAFVVPISQKFCRATRKLGIFRDNHLISFKL